MQSKIKFPIIAIVLVVLLAAACSDRVPTTPVNTGPEHYGVFVKTDKGLLETAQFRGYPSTDATLPMVANSQPTFVVWLQNLVLDYVVLLDNLGSGNQVAYTARPVGSDGVVEIQPKYSLPFGAYCLVKGDPLASPADVPFYCFRVGDSTAAGAVAPTGAGQLPANRGTPTPNPGAQQNAVAAASTQLVKPGNAATQAAAEQVIKQATIAVQAERAKNVAEALGAREQLLARGKACTSRVRAKVEAGDYSDIRPGADLVGCDLHGLNLFGLDLSGVDLSYANLTGANLKGVVLSSASSLKGADLTSANLDGANLANVDVRLAVFSLPLPAGVDPDVVIQNAVTSRGDSLPAKLFWSPKGYALPDQWTEAWHNVAADSSTAGLLRRLYAVSRADEQIEFSPDGRFFMFVDVDLRHGGVGFTVTDIGPDSRQNVVIETRPTYFSAWHPNNNLIAFYNLDDDKSYVWDLSAKKEVQKLEGVFETWSPDGKAMVISSPYEGVDLFDAQTGNKIMDLSGIDAPSRVLYSPDGRWLLAYQKENGWVRVLDPSTGATVLDLQKVGISDILWSSDSASLVIKRPSDTARFYSVGSSFDLLREIKLNQLWRVDLDPDAQWAVVVGLEPASFGQDGFLAQMRIVDLDSGADIAIAFLPWDTIRANAAVSPEGNMIAIELLRGVRGQRDGWTTSLQLWPVSELIEKK